MAAAQILHFLKVFEDQDMIVNMCSGKMAFFLWADLRTLHGDAKKAGYEGAATALESAWNRAMSNELSWTVGTDQPNAPRCIVNTRAYLKAFGKRFGHPCNPFTFNTWNYAACVLGTVSSALAYWDWYVKQEIHYTEEWKQKNGYPVCDSPFCVRRVTYNVYTSRFSRWCTFHWQEDKSMDDEPALRGYKAVATYAETALRAAIAADAAAAETAVQAAVRVGVPESFVRAAVAAAAGAGETAAAVVQAAVRVGVPESGVRAAAAAARAAAAERLDDPRASGAAPPDETAEAAETAETTAETAVWNAVQAAVVAARCKFSGCEFIVELKRDKNRKSIFNERSEAGWCRIHSTSILRGESTFSNAMLEAYEKWNEHQDEKAFEIATALECVEKVQKEIEKVQMEMEKQAETEDEYTRNSRTYHLNDLKKRLREAKAAVPDIRCTFCESGERVDEFTGKPGPARCYLLKKSRVKNGKRSLLAYCNSHVSQENRAAGTCAGSGETNRWPKNHRESQKSEGKVSELKDKKGKAPVGAANAPIVLDDEEDESQRGNSASDGASPTHAGKRSRGADDQRDDTPSRPRQRTE